MSHEVEVQQYPKAMHGPDEGYAVVNSEEEESALGEGWVNGHEYWAAKAEEPEDGDEDSTEAPAKVKRGRKPKVAE